MTDPQPLSKNDALVYGALRKADQPLSAYDLLDQLRDQGLRAPVQIYRALDRLLGNGMAHRLESLNAFVACCNSDGHSHGNDDGQTAFAICEACGKVLEFSDPALVSQLTAWAHQQAFTPSRTTIELRGLCVECKPA